MMFGFAIAISLAASAYGLPIAESNVALPAPRPVLRVRSGARDSPLLNLDLLPAEDEEGRAEEASDTDSAEGHLRGIVGKGGSKKTSAERERGSTEKLASTAGHYTSPNDVLSRTVFVIKAYNRPACLRALLESIVLHAPWMPVIVGDDSTESLASLVASVKGFDVGNTPVHIRLPVDSGTGYGRNRIVQAAHDAGYEFLIMSDDDYLITNRDLIPRMAQAFISLNADVVSPLRCDLDYHGKPKPHACRRGSVASILRSEKNELFLLKNITRPYVEHTRTQEGGLAQLLGVNGNVSHLQLNATAAGASHNFRHHPLQQSSMSVDQTPVAELDCHRSDLVQQFFLARTANMKVNGWDDHLKNNDHYDFMLTQQAKGMRLYMCRALSITHNKSACSNVKSTIMKEYKETRKNRWMDLVSYWLNKWNITAFNDEVGRRWSLDPTTGEVQTQCGVRCVDMPVSEMIGCSDSASGTPDSPRGEITKSQNFECDAVRRTFNPDGFLQQQQLHQNSSLSASRENMATTAARSLLEGILNSQLPSWKAVSLPTENQHHWGLSNMGLQSFGPCEVVIKGAFSNAKYIFQPTKVLTKTLRMEYSVLTPYSCPVYEQLLDMVEPRIPRNANPVSIAAATRGERMRHVYYVTVVSDVDIPLDSLLAQLAAQHLKHGPESGTVLGENLRVSFVLVVMSKAGATDEWRQRIVGALGGDINVTIKVTAPPFGRSIGLRMGFDLVDRLVTEAGENKREVAVFSLDASMKIPLDFTLGIARAVHCGISAYFPVCFKESDEGGDWVEAGYGMLGVCLEDYNSLLTDGSGDNSLNGGGWREHWWYRWGAEDLDMVQQLQRKLIIHRPRIKNFHHIKIHPSNTVEDTRHTNPLYYSKKNMWPDALPIVPISEPLRDVQDSSIRSTSRSANSPLPVEAFTDADLRKRLIAFVRKRTGKPHAEFADEIWRTPARHRDNMLILFSMWTKGNSRLHIVSQAEMERGVVRLPPAKNSPIKTNH